MNKNEVAELCTIIRIARFLYSMKTTRKYGNVTGKMMKALH